MYHLCWIVRVEGLGKVRHLFTLHFFTLLFDWLEKIRNLNYHCDQYDFDKVEEFLNPTFGRRYLHQLYTTL